MDLKANKCYNMTTQTTIRGMSARTMNNFVDYYKMLQVHHEADREIVNAAYRCISRMFHPDLNGSEAATEQMKMINVAYSVLGNPAKRRDYDREWVRSKRGRVENKIKEKPEPFVSTVEMEKKAAKKILTDFFDDLIKEEWERSYQKLTIADRNNIPIGDYIEWKNAVSNLYKLGNYKVDYFCTYENCEYAGSRYSKILHFSITLTEMETATGKVNQDQTHKYVAKDREGWKVCLGYTELKSSIRKYKYLAKAFPKTNREEIIAKALDSIDPLTGIYSREGFVEQGEKELRRCERYGNPLSLATVEFRPSNEESFDGEKDGLMSSVSEMLSGKARETDILGRCGESAFAILLVETKLVPAKEAMERLLNVIENEDIKYEIYWGITELIDGDFRNHLDGTLEKAILKERLSSIEGDKVKLGKYHLSDILDFNKKGRNHF